MFYFPALPSSPPPLTNIPMRPVHPQLCRERGAVDADDKSRWRTRGAAFSGAVLQRRLVSQGPGCDRPLHDVWHGTGPVAVPHGRWPHRNVHWLCSAYPTVRVARFYSFASVNHFARLCRSYPPAAASNVQSLLLISSHSQLHPPPTPTPTYPNVHARQ